MILRFLILWETVGLLLYARRLLSAIPLIVSRFHDMYDRRMLWKEGLTLAIFLGIIAPLDAVIWPLNVLREWGRKEN